MAVNLWARQELETSLSCGLGKVSEHSLLTGMREAEGVTAGER